MRNSNNEIPYMFSIQLFVSSNLNFLALKYLSNNGFTSLSQFVIFVIRSFCFSNNVPGNALSKNMFLFSTSNPGISSFILSVS